MKKAKGIDHRHTNPLHVRNGRGSVFPNSNFVINSLFGFLHFTNSYPFVFIRG
jgi:hypothetical protein